MHLINNLYFLKSANNGDFRGKHDGIYKRGEDFYITFCHGGMDGTMSLQMNGRTRDVLPSQFRKMIATSLDVVIPEDKKLFINPCMVENVRREYPNDLKLNNVFIYSDKDFTHTWFMMGTERGRIPENKKIAKNRKVCMVVIDFAKGDEDYYLNYNMGNNAIKQLAKKAKKKVKRR